MFYFLKYIFNSVLPICFLSNIKWNFTKVSVLVQNPPIEFFCYLIIFECVWIVRINFYYYYYYCLLVSHWPRGAGCEEIRTNGWPKCKSTVHYYILLAQRFPNPSGKRPQFKITNFPRPPGVQYRFFLSSTPDFIICIPFEPFMKLVTDSPGLYLMRDPAYMQKQWKRELHCYSHTWTFSSGRLKHVIH